MAFSGNTGLFTDSPFIQEDGTSTDLAILTGTELFDGGRTPAETNLTLNISGTRGDFVTTTVDLLDRADGVNDGNAVEVENLNFTIFDVDRSNLNWQDRVVIRGYNDNLGGVEILPSVYINPSSASGNPGHIFFNGASNDVLATANLTPNNLSSSGSGTPANGNVGVTFTQPVTRFEVDYYNGPDANDPSLDHAIGLIGNIQFCAPPFDFGDAPNTYLTQGSTGASHIISDAIRIGSVAPDSETNASTPLDGTGDNVTGTNDENTVTISGLDIDDTTYSLTVPVTNTSGFDATLVGWIDFDGDDAFDADEGATVAVPDGSTDSNVALTWNDIGSTGPNIVAGDTFARFRLTTDTITTSNPGGSLGGGEVEDYTLTIIDPTAVSDPDLLLVKHITGRERDGIRTSFNTYRDDGSLIDDPGDNFPDTTDDNAAFWPGYSNVDDSNTFTVGELAIEARPGDIVDYTIYFLNAGGSDATNVKICDLLGQFLTYIPNAYDVNTPADGGNTNNLGIELSFAGSIVYLTGASGDGTDRGEFYGTGTVPVDCVIEDPSGSGTFRAITGTDNANDGTVTVELSTVEDAVGIGDPNNSFGYIRFRTSID